jgi:hypothetical protein
LRGFPGSLSGFISIPDSVEIFSFKIVLNSSPRTFVFGDHSRLAQVRPSEGRAFLQVSTRSLKALRQNAEFARDDLDWWIYQFL